MFQVKFTPTAAKAFKHLQPDIKKQLKSALRDLGDNPYLGKPLQNDLALFRSLKINRYRIIYHLDDHSHTLIIVALGHRRTIYDIASHLPGTP